MSLERNWLKFAGGPTDTPSSHIRVTINHKGQIHLSRTAHAVFGRPKAVSLYYEPDLQSIGVEPAEPRRVESFPLIPKTFGAYYIPAAPFCRHHRINITGTEAFIRPDVRDDGVMILDLRQTSRVGGWSSRRK
jgi:hypothetical protein